MEGLLADVDMDVLTETPWVHWSTHNHISVAHSLSSRPPVWQTSVQEKPLSTSWKSSDSEFSAQTMLYTPSLNTGAHEHWKPAGNDSSASVASTQHTSNPYPFDATRNRNRSQDTGEVHWQEPPQHAGAPHSTSVATLVDEFERSLTLVIPSSEADPIHHSATTLRISPDQPVDFPLPRSPGNNKHQYPVCPLPLDNSIPSFLKRGSTTLLEQGRDRSEPSLASEPSERDRICFLDLADQPRPPRDTTSLPTYTLDEPPANPNSAPHAYPRPPTPPVSRRRPLKSTRRTTGTTCYPAKIASLAELPVAQKSVQRGQRNQSRPDLSAGRASQPTPRCPQVLCDDGLELCGCGSGWGVPSSLMTTPDLVLRNPTSARCSRRRRKVEAEEGEGEQRRPERRTRIKQTRFVVPDSEDEREASSLDRSRRTRPSDSTRRTGGPEPLRSILRNKLAPYDKGTVRHVARGVSVP